MDTEYLDIVNKELDDIQQFFAHYYCSLDPSVSTTCPSILLPAQRTLTVLPLLKPPLTAPVDSDASTSFETSSSFSFSSSLAGGSFSERDQYVNDLRDRYKQLKTIQDQMHLELTRARILRQSMLPVSVGNGDEKGDGVSRVDAESSRSFSLHEEKESGLLESTRHEQDSFTSTPLSKPVQPAPEPTLEPTTPATTTTTAATPTDVPTSHNMTLFPNMRRLATKLYKDAKTTTYLAHKSALTGYILLTLGLAIILGGLLLNYDQNRYHNHNHNNVNEIYVHECATEPLIPRPVYSPSTDYRYPWPRH